MRKILKGLTLFITIFLAFSIWYKWHHQRQIADFYAQAKVQLESFPGGDAPSHIPMIVRFPSGEWIAVVLEHGCCSGAGFDAVLIRDSENHFYQADKNYCGYEGFDRDFYNKISDLKSAREYFRKNGYKEQ